MFEWLRRALRRSPSAPSAAPLRGTTAPPAATTAAGGGSADPAPANVFSAEDLGVDPNTEAQFSLDDDDDDDEALAPLIDQIRQHFLDNRPDPTSFPSLATRVIALVEHPDVDVNKLVQAIQQDPAISIQVLKVANSAAYRRDREITELRAAITDLGLREIAAISAGVAGRSLFDAETRAEFEFYGAVWGRLFSAAMVTAMGSTWLAMQHGSRRSDGVFLGGLFHDIGKSLALRSMAGLLITGKIFHVPSERTILRAVEAVHVELGSSMLQTWGLPAELQLITARHHEPMLPASPELRHVHIVRLVSGLQILGTSTDVPRGLVNEVLVSVGALGLNRFELRALRTQLAEVELRVGAMFQIPEVPGPRAS